MSWTNTLYTTFVWELVKYGVTIMVIFCILLLCLSLVLSTIRYAITTIFFPKPICKQAPQKQPAKKK